MELAPEEVVVVTEPRDVARTAVDIGKVVVVTERRPHMDKKSTTYG